MIHVYGVVDGLEELPPVAGLEGAPLERRRVDGFELVLSRGETPPSAEVSREAVLRHAQIVEELMSRSAALLPAQLGHAFRDDEELAAAIRGQASQLARGLDRVRGCVEFGLRAVAAPVGDSDTARSGSEYMRARLEEARRQDRLVGDLHQPLARLARESTLRRAGAGEIRAAYLVGREESAAFREAVSRLGDIAGVTVVCTGPWPPYSFAADTEDAR